MKTQKEQELTIKDAENGYRIMIRDKKLKDYRPLVVKDIQKIYKQGIKEGIEIGKKQSPFFGWSYEEIEYNGKAQAISEFKEKLKEALCIDKDEDCKVNCCKTQGGKDNFICKNCNQIEKTAQEITK